MNLGLVHIYCGDGKGKTTACIGLSVRAAGRGFKVLFVQFLKGRTTGELNSFELFENIEVMRGKETTKFTFQMNEEEKQVVAQEHEKLFSLVLDKINNEKIDLLVLDEVIGACNAGVFSLKRLITFLQEKPAGLEVVLSGRNPVKELIELADYVSEVKMIKHPLKKGIPARDGIER
jgi:cob(I)alamin adenosyltransferase